MTTPATLIDAALDAFIAALAGTVQVEQRIFEAGSAAFTKDAAPAIEVEAQTGDGQTLGDNGPLRSLLRVSVNVELRIYTRSAIAEDGTEQVPRQLAAPIWKSAHGLLMADPTLGGLAQRLRWRRVSWQKDAADGLAGWTVHTYELTLAMHEHTLAAP